MKYTYDKCPICEGRGFVPAGFYGETHGKAIECRNEECRSCHGKGIVSAIDFGDNNTNGKYPSWWLTTVDK